MRRYEVTELCGFRSVRGHSRTEPGVSCHVIDTVWNRRLVAVFCSEDMRRPDGKRGGYPNAEAIAVARAKAHELCDGLNGAAPEPEPEPARAAYPQELRRRGGDHAADDLSPTCPRCGDLSARGSTHCNSCRARLL
jgi:hypothetical protein